MNDKIEILAKVFNGFDIIRKAKYLFNERIEYLTWNNKTVIIKQSEYKRKKCFMKK